MKTGHVLIVFILISFSALAHPFFISMTDIVFNEKEKQLELSVRIFTDDLEKQLAKDCACKVDFASKKDSARLGRILHSYLQKSLKLKVNNKNLATSYIGFEMEEESIWTYLESAQREPISKLEINNSLLYQTQPKQTNLVRIRMNGQDKTHQLLFPQEMLVFQF